MIMSTGNKIYLKFSVIGAYPYLLKKMLLKKCINVKNIIKKHAIKFLVVFFVIKNGMDGD